MKILAADDKPRSLKLAHAMLASEGYDVSPADGAWAVLARIRADKPDLILLDLALPDTDGLTLINMLKNDPETCDVHIIAITAFPDRFTQDAAVQAGAAAYVMKPLDTRNISGLVNKITKEKSVRTKVQPLAGT